MITLISLIGVSLGVMVLIVVMSVMAGFEDLVKERVLGQSPHITAVRAIPWDTPDKNGETRGAEVQWRELVTKLENLPNVTSAYPLVQDYVIVDHQGTVLPVMMRGIDSADKQAMADLKKLTIKGDSDIGMGSVATFEALPAETIPMDDAAEPAGEQATDEVDVVEVQSSDVAVISSIFADENQLDVGDTIQVISNRNLKMIKPLLDRKGSLSVYASDQPFFEEFTAYLQNEWKAEGDDIKVEYASIQPFQAHIESIKFSNIREREREMVEDLLLLTKTDRFDDVNNYYPKERLGEILAQITALKDVDIKQLDEEEQNQFNEVALPKDIQIAAIYQADRYAPGPPLLVPLHLAQELAGAGTTGGINGVAMRLTDAYQAGKVLEEEVKPIVGAEWTLVSWMTSHEQQFSLISMQKTMMMIALSFIVLVAVFSIGAVMFTVTVQKKREIGVMKALGATPGQVTAVFALQGVIVGFIGSLIGVGLSLLVLRNLETIQGVFKRMGFDPFSGSFYGFETLPYIINPLEILVVSICAFILCALAAYGPAWMASQTDAARSLRNM